MGRSASLVFLRDDNEDRIGLELVELLREEEYRLGSRRHEVGYLTTGAASWSLLRAEPPDLLSAHAPGSDHPRLVALAKRLRCDGFHFELLEDESVTLLEVSADGAHLTSGPDLERPSFSLITVPDNLRYIVDDEDVEGIPERVARALGVDQNAVEDETADTIVVWYTPSRLTEQVAETPRQTPENRRARGRATQRKPTKGKGKAKPR